VLCRGLEKNGMVRAWHGHGMASVNQTWPHCVNQMGKTHSKPSATRHGRGTAWAWHAMCESTLTGYGHSSTVKLNTKPFQHDFVSATVNLLRQIFNKKQWQPHL